jgi:hypothetical protein
MALSISYQRARRRKVETDCWRSPEGRCGKNSGPLHHPPKKPLKSAFENVVRSPPAAWQGSGSGDGDEGFGVGGELLVVADEAPALEDPGECALDRPAQRRHLEAFGARAATDDFERDVGLSAAQCTRRRA